MQIDNKSRSPCTHKGSRGQVVNKKHYMHVAGDWAKTSLEGPNAIGLQRDAIRAVGVFGALCSHGDRVCIRIQIDDAIWGQW
jgi:hypothetical protein